MAGQWLRCNPTTEVVVSDGNTITITTQYTATLKAVVEDDGEGITFVVMDARNNAHVAIISRDAATALTRWLQARIAEM
jgi:molybdopterin-guanine dinucleotide biosynthesis protein A